MYIIIGIVIFLGALGLFYYLENRRVTRLKQEKAEGKWDFIDREYLPYLASHPEAVKETGELTFSIHDGFDKWSGLTGVFHYNAAGVYCQIISPFNNAPAMIFVWGKDKPARFSPVIELRFHSIEIKEGSKIILLLKKVNKNDPDYTLTIKNASPELYNELKRVLDPGA